MNQVTAASSSVDPGVALTTIGLVAGAFVSVGLYYYLRFMRFAERWFIQRTKHRIARAAPYLRVKTFGRLLWLIDVTTAICLRATIALYASLFLLIIVPFFLGIGSLILAASIIHFQK